MGQCPETERKSPEVTFAQKELYVERSAVEARSFCRRGSRDKNVRGQVSGSGSARKRKERVPKSRLHKRKCTWSDRRWKLGGVVSEALVTENVRGQVSGSGSARKRKERGPKSRLHKRKCTWSDRLWKLGAFVGEALVTKTYKARPVDRAVPGNGQKGSRRHVCTKEMYVERSTDEARSFCRRGSHNKNVRGQVSGSGSARKRKERVPKSRLHKRNCTWSDRRLKLGGFVGEALVTKTYEARSVGRGVPGNGKKGSRSHVCTKGIARGAIDG